MASNPRTLLGLAALLSGLAAGALGCSSPSSGPSLKITFVTTGSPEDPDGYAVTIPTRSGEFPDPNGSVTFEDVAIGAHTIVVSGIADNCAVSGDNPRTVTVEAEERAETTFNVICGPMPVGTVVVEGSQVIIGARPTITLHLRNDGGPGIYRIEFWAWPTSDDEPAIFMDGTEEVAVDENYEETVTYEIETNRIAAYALIFTSNDENNPGFRQTDLFYFD